MNNRKRLKKNHQSISGISFQKLTYLTEYIEAEEAEKSTK